jgi:energy-coupling factor transporter ATP-binding protein EcfA2
MIAPSPHPVPRRPVVVEFCGVSGSGKTTLARQLTALLRERGWTVSLRDTHTDSLGHRIRSGGGKLLFALWLALRHPRLALTRARAIVPITGRPSLPGLRAALNDLALTAFLFRARDRVDAIVLDQGFVQGACSLRWLAPLPGHSPGLPGLVSPLLQFPEPIIVMVIADPSVIAPRLRLRTHAQSRVQLNPKEYPAEKEAGHFHSVTEELRDIARIRSLTVRSEARSTPSKLALRIVDAVLRGSPVGEAT